MCIGDPRCAVKLLEAVLFLNLGMAGFQSLMRRITIFRVWLPLRPPLAKVHTNTCMTRSHSSPQSSASQ
ncbi:hypothetical protein AN958_02345 [Leucoagaricus sp. SymC.cos]|nr:hypothetical protein AN958_02345 [Leucoagaricus sp. SymC.cos]